MRYSKREKIKATARAVVLGMARRGRERNVLEVNDPDSDWLDVE